jgi:hypothetical protein
MKTGFPLFRPLGHRFRSSPEATTEVTEGTERAVAEARSPLRCPLRLLWFCPPRTRLRCPLRLLWFCPPRTPLRCPAFCGSVRQEPHFGVLCLLWFCPPRTPLRCPLPSVVLSAKNPTSVSSVPSVVLLQEPPLRCPRLLWFSPSRTPDSASSVPSAVLSFKSPDSASSVPSVVLSFCFQSARRSHNGIHSPLLR